jgi:transcriptional antiterminator
MLEVEDKISKLKLDYHKITFLLFSYPFLSISDFKDKLSVTKNTIIRNIKKLEEA